MRSWSCRHWHGLSGTRFRRQRAEPLERDLRACTGAGAVRRRRRRRKVGKHISLSATDADWETVRSNANRRGLSIARYLVELVEREASEEDAGLRHECPELALAAMTNTGVPRTPRVLARCQSASSYPRFSSSDEAAIGHWAGLILPHGIGPSLGYGRLNSQFVGMVLSLPPPGRLLAMAGRRVR